MELSLITGAEYLSREDSTVSIAFVGSNPPALMFPICCNNILDH